MIGWSKHKLVDTSVAMHYGIKWPVGISIVPQSPLKIPLHNPNDRQKPVVRAVQGDCEIYYNPGDFTTSAMDMFPPSRLYVIIRYHMLDLYSNTRLWNVHRADFRFALSQWETSLQSNAVSHWLGANIESALTQYNPENMLNVCFVFQLFWWYQLFEWKHASC